MDWRLLDSLRSTKLVHFELDSQYFFIQTRKSKEANRCLSLNLGVIAFTDLEVLLIGCPTLRYISLWGGLHDYDLQDTVSPLDHAASLRGLIITSAGTDWIGPRGLGWLLYPTVGSLKELKLGLPVRKVSVPCQTELTLGL